MMRSLILLLAVVCALSANAQIFKKGDRVCFVGNSITHNGDYWHNIQLYYATRFPSLDVKFFNCGISGDVTAGILRRMNSDILVHRPTWAVIMIGMNDVNRPLYDARRKNEPGIREKQLAALTAYKKNLDSVIRVFRDKGVNVILQTPSIYDQTAKIAANNLFGVNDALKACAEFIKDEAEKDKLTVVDYWTMLSNLNAEVQRADSTATLIGKDRVHPGGTGHLLMAWEFLRATKAPAIVSTIVIDRDAASSRSKSRQCEITNMKRTDELISFTCREKALPFPLREDQMEVPDIVAFDNSINREVLQFNYIKPGNYILSIDGEEIGKYFSGELERGINLSRLRNLQQYRQAVTVRELLRQSWELESRLRTLRLIEHRYINQLPDNKNLGTVRKFYDTAHAHKPDTDYVKKLFLQYLENKPAEEDIRRKWQRSLDSLPKLNKPVAHDFVLRKAG
ncbi:SGNH/GDSL hydrolase family protein [Chitinophaga sp. XS-30]|uniref:SGNH/GDSL hydrolase family protein n=1 Tax=Chitinophaga sp. XS-30 TaxID=2604421 RepID=UPI0011DCDE56|nr:SGNH/GDSL hydrolase family protein [Chitinophaga sp. XS-30]QEH40796.1 SGNH/GDSL hydrolase family protein [Chitinophaga sp. XS-30]